MPPYEHAELGFKFQARLILAERHSEAGTGYRFERLIGNDEETVEVEIFLGEEAEDATMNLTASHATNSETGRTYHLECSIEWHKDELTALRDYLTFLIAPR